MFTLRKREKPDKEFNDEHGEQINVRYLLAVDLGLRTGLALYDENGKLVWYRSHNFGTTERLRRGVHGLLEGTQGLAAIIIEGGGNLATVWEREAERRNISLCRVSAEVWRKAFLLSREQRTGTEAKKNADAMARKIIEWSAAPRPTALRHDAAEAILVGLWGILHLGWLGGLPPELQR
jgi:hypothetical protein